MKKGFSSKKIEELFEKIICENSLNGSQLCELGNRIWEYGCDRQYKEKELKRKSIEHGHYI